MGSDIFKSFSSLQVEAGEIELERKVAKQVRFGRKTIHDYNGGDEQFDCESSYKERIGEIRREFRRTLWRPIRVFVQVTIAIVLVGLMALVIL